MGAKPQPPLATDITDFLHGGEAITASVPPTGPKAEDISQAKPTQTTAKAKTKRPTANGVPDKDKMPWDDLDASAMQPFSSRINARLYAQLQFVATHQNNITKIVNDAISEKVGRLLKERGVKA